MLHPGGHRSGDVACGMQRMLPRSRRPSSGIHRDLPKPIDSHRTDGRTRLDWTWTPQHWIGPPAMLPLKKITTIEHIPSEKVIGPSWHLHNSVSNPLSEKVRLDPWGMLRLNQLCTSPRGRGRAAIDHTVAAKRRWEMVLSADGCRTQRDVWSPNLWREGFLHRPEGSGVKAIRLFLGVGLSVWSERRWNSRSCLH